MAAVLLACLLGGILLASIVWMMWPSQAPAAPVRVHLKAPSELAGGDRPGHYLPR